jgi:DNA-binding GntR family transcriptional regulator
VRRSSARLRPIQKLPAEQMAAQALRDHILRGDLRPGARVTEASLATQFDLSRGTIRAALHLLSQEGLIIQVPYTGWTVMPLSARDAWELYTLRASLEGLAARLTSAAIEAGKRSTLTDAFETLVKCCKKGQRRLVADADFKLHKTIVALSGHRRLAEQYRLVEQQIRIYIESSDSLVSDYQICIDHHRPIVEAILSGDCSTAERVSGEHNITEGKKLVAVLEKQERVAACNKLAS